MCAVFGCLFVEAGGELSRGALKDAALAGAVAHRDQLSLVADQLMRWVAKAELPPGNLAASGGAHYRKRYVRLRLAIKPPKPPPVLLEKVSAARGGRALVALRARSPRKR